MSDMVRIIGERAYALDAKINTFRLRNAIVLDAADSELSNRSFSSMALSRAIAESGSTPASG